MNRRSLFKILASATAFAAMEVCGLKPLVKAEVIEFRVGEFVGTFPSGFSYQWFRDRVPIEGALSNSYVIVPEDAGRTIDFSFESTQSSE